MTRLSNILVSFCAMVAFLGCSSNGNSNPGDAGSGTDTDSQSNPSGDADADSDAYSDADADGDSDGDTDADADGDSDGDSDADTDDTNCVDNDSDSWCAAFDCDDKSKKINPAADEIYDPPNSVDEDCDGLTDEEPTEPDKGSSYIWIANTGEGTISKIDTELEIEMARYITTPLGAVAEGDPSRTTINRYGDAVVLNRRHPTRFDKSSSSSVTKFAASIDDCIDRNKNKSIETSSGGKDVLAWEADECMLWHTSLGVGIRAARAAAWDGQEDPDTGVGGHVWIGTCEKLENNGAKDFIFKLDGDTGEITETIDFAGCAYGAAMDSNGDLWIVDRDAAYAVHRLDTETLAVDTYATAAGYGIAIDSAGVIWATGNAGLNRVSWYDPSTGTADSLILDSEYSFPRGAGAGVGLSAGYVWVADNNGYLLKFDEKTFTLADAYPVGATASPSTIGIGIDAKGYVWIVSMAEDTVFKFDPVSETYVSIEVGLNPYTYSDMTGIQLLKQIPPI